MSFEEIEIFSIQTIQKQKRIIEHSLRSNALFPVLKTTYHFKFEVDVGF